VLLMVAVQDIRSVSSELSTPDMLRFLIEKTFAGKTMVTASLKAPSITVLKMVADIDPATPVVFCVRGFQFPESAVYRDRIVKLLGLKNVSLSSGSEVDVSPGDLDHSERMWVETENLLGRSYEIAHLNRTLSAYDCWISAVYHDPGQPITKQRVDVEGRLIRINPLIRWSKTDIRFFMREHGLPFHPRAARRIPAPPLAEQPVSPTYSY